MHSDNRYLLGYFKTEGTIFYKYLIYSLFREIKQHVWDAFNIEIPYRFQSIEFQRNS